jgi:hypothetical protein
MSRARSAFIHPNKIETIDDWIKGTAKRYGNLILRKSDGAMLVLDPTTLDASAPVKTFPRTKAIDAIAYLNTGDVPQLREQAATRMATLTSERNAAVETTNEVFRAKEKELLEKHQQWRNAETESDRTIVATEIGILQKELATLDTQRRQATFPKRYILEKEMKRIILDDDTGQKRTAQRTVFGVNYAMTDAKDREITLETTK